MDQQISDLHSDQFCSVGTHYKVPLAGRPQFALTISTVARQARVRLDVALMHGRRFEAHLNDFIGRGKARSNVTNAELYALRYI
jgi:hypothetical protein